MRAREVGAFPSQVDPNLAEAYPISVVIPCHNAAQELKLCLEALLKNDLTHVEILIVDDASSDSTVQVAAGFRQAEEGKSPIQCLLLERKSGPGVARNEGLERARHPYLLFLDADIILGTRSIEWIRESLDLYSHRSDIAGVLGSYSEVTPWDDFLTNFKNLCICFLYRTTDTLSPYLHTPIFCVRREILKQAGGFDARFSTAEDFYLGILLGTEGFRFVIDRRLQGTHLKQYTLTAILREDWRRIRDLGAIKLNRKQRRFALRAHRLHRLLSLVLPGPVLFCGVLTLLNPIYGTIAVLLLIAFYLCNVPFLIYTGDRRGFGFALKAALFLFFEMLWAEIALVGFLLRSLNSSFREYDDAC
ncbi:glycosyltransferase [Acidobacteria bacterium AH-259-D05]|nr:glycosyltransferase [Acidobacteria bacterium AH-259-D05]